MIEPLPQALAYPLVSGLVVAGIGFAVVLALVPLIISHLSPAISRRVDRDLHDVHKTPVPRLGGIALAAAFAVIAPAILAFVSFETERFQARLTIAITGAAMFALGLFDDIRPLGARKKLIGQILIASIAFYCGLKMDRLRNPLTGTLYTLGWMEMPATVLWLVALTNLINLIDGIDGLAGGICLMLMSLLAFVGLAGHSFSFYVSMGMAGALLAFLKFNFPPAHVHLGDGGAYFLGYLIGALTIQNSNKGTIAAALIAPIFALALPILDVSFSIVRRSLKGLPIFRPDRRHIHHRLLQAGFSRRRAVITLYALSLVFLAIAFVAFWSDGRLIPILFGCAFLVLLLTAPGLGIIRNWLTVGRTVGHSLEMRRDVQYAVLLRNWLELEAERCQSVEELCRDLQFLSRKLGFVELVVTVGGELRSWRHPEFPDQRGLQTVRYELFLDGDPVWLDLRAPTGAMDDKHFQLLAELIAEAWLHASRRWRKVHRKPFAFDRNPIPGSVHPSAPSLTARST